MTVIVRPLEPGDRTDWDRLWTAYLSFYETERPKEVFDTYFARLMSDDPQDFSGLIAERGGRAIGSHFFKAYS